MKINNKEFGNIFLAPMAGVTEVGFRHACKLGGADTTFTEMVSAKALSYNNEKTKQLLYTSDFETPKVVQLFGHEISAFEKTLKSGLLEKFDMIDLNFGCPAPKIVSNGDGSALLKDLKNVEQIVKTCVKFSSVPISCKFRKGYNAEDNIAVQMAKLCEESGASLIIVHGRTKSQMYSGVVDLDTIAKVKANVKIPVVGNGDIVDIKSYKNMLSTGVDAVMIGRGALGNPNVFNELKGQKLINKFELVKEHIEMLQKFYSEKFITVTMRKHLLWYVSGIDGVNEIKQKIATAPTLAESLELTRKLLVH